MYFEFFSRNILSSKKFNDKDFYQSLCGPCVTVTRLPPPCDHVWIINTELSPALQSTVNTGADHADDGWIQRVEASAV